MKTILDAIRSYGYRAKMREFVLAISDGNLEDFRNLLIGLRKEEDFLDASSMLLGVSCSDTSDFYYLEELLSCGLDPNRSNSFGIYPLHIAVENGKLDAVKLLLSYGADPNVRDSNGVTPLHISYSYDGLAEISDLLIRNGANPNLRDNIGKRYLM
ncbi:ankyrin repeat domain-containing protein [Leptospira wolffii]|uniref:Ankyrin repeat domain-containing protein n=1 Tax=Leptospira wolffii TaxID=409998 RepID=A0ABV5BQA8_9LEPT|nr:ankyrin repeat domain-containing protein [Leptospira wolffii]